MNDINILNSLKLLQQYITPLSDPLKVYNITFFSYSRIYENSKGIFLCNNDSWYDIKFKNDLFDEDGFVTLKKISADKYTKSIFTGMPKQDIKVLGYMYNNNIWNSIDLYRHIEDYTEVFNFSSTCENENIINYYINNIEFLENYANYFHDKISSIINNKKEELYIDIKPSSEKTLILPNTDNCNFFPNEQCKCNFSFMINNAKVNLSSRQIQCLALIGKGKTAKEIARMLNISHRTVEEYANQLKIKLKCINHNALIAFVAENIHIINAALLKN